MPCARRTSVAFTGATLRRKPEITVDALSVVRVRAQSAPNARSGRTLGREREGTGVVIDSSGLVLTIGYLITEAEKIELSTADGKIYPATVVGFDNATGLGLLKSLVPVPVKPIDMGLSAEAKERDMVLIVGFDGVAPAYVVSKRQFVGYWEYLLDEAIYTAPATVNWQGAALVSSDGKLLGIGSLAVGNAMGEQRSVPGNMFVPIPPDSGLADHFPEALDFVADVPLEFGRRAADRLRSVRREPFLHIGRAQYFVNRAAQAIDDRRGRALGRDHAVPADQFKAREAFPRRWARRAPRASA